VVTHQLQVESRTAKARRPKTDVLPLDHAVVTNSNETSSVYAMNSIGSPDEPWGTGRRTGRVV